MMRRRRAGLAGAVITLLAAAPAAADAGPDAKQACIAAAEQGQSQRDDGKYRAARASFVACAADECPRIIAQSCTKWLRELDESAPTIVLAAKDEHGNDLTDVKVTFDGAPFVNELDGKPIEADVGEHVLRFERDGSAPVEEKLLLRAGERARVVTVTMRPGGAGGGGDEAGPEPLLSARHVVSAGLVAGGLAAAAIAVVFLVKSSDDQSTAQDLRTRLGSPSACSGASSASCSALASAVDSQHAETNVATGLFIGGGAALAGAVAAWFLWPRAKPPDRPEPPATAAVAPVRGGLTFQFAGRF